MTWGQDLTIREIRREEQIAKLDLGQARLIMGYKQFNHIVEVGEYTENILGLKKALESIQSNEIPRDTVSILKTKLQKVKDKLYTILPRQRQRRGIFNGLGSIIKVVTENMDANDQEKIEKALEDKEQRTNKISKIINEQTEFEKEIIIRFNNITDHINKEQNIITNFLSNYKKDLYKKLNQEHNEILVIQYVNRIKYTFVKTKINSNNHIVPDQN